MPLDTLLVDLGAALLIGWVVWYFRLTERR